MSITKQCSKCGEVKVFADFYKHKNGKHGVTSKCKQCYRDYHEENKPKILRRQRQYRADNKMYVYDLLREGRKKNAEKIRERSRKYAKENPEVGRRANRKRRAMKRNLPHQPLTPQQYEVLRRQKYEIFGGIANEH